MPGRKKSFSIDSRRQRYAAAGINEKLIYNFLNIHCAMRAQYEGRGSRSRVLIVLNGAGPITQKALTERLELQPGTVSGILAPMEALGLIERRANPDDRRTALIVLTEAGRQAAQQAADLRLRRHQEMFSCLSDAEKQALLALLETVNADWMARYQAQPDEADRNK